MKQLLKKAGAFGICAAMLLSGMIMAGAADDAAAKPQRDALAGGGLFRQGDKGIVLNDFDAASPNGVGGGIGGISDKVTIDTTDKKVGAGSLKMVGQNDVWIETNDFWGWESIEDSHMLSTLTADKMSDYVLTLWFRTNDNTSLPKTALQLGNDASYSTALIFTLDTDIVNKIPNNEWVKLEFALDGSSLKVNGQEASETEVAYENKNFNMEQLKGFRMLRKADSAPELVADDGDIVWLDDVRIIDKTLTADDYTGSLPRGDKQVVLDCNDAELAATLSFWNGDAPSHPTVNETYAKEGGKSYQLAAKAGQGNALQVPFAEAITLPAGASVYYLAVDLYVEDVSKLDVASMNWIIADEFTSEINMNWWLKSLDDGWNRIVLPLNTTTEPSLTLNHYAAAVCSGTGLTQTDGSLAFKTMQLNFPCTADTNVYLDNVQIISQFPPVSVDAAPTATADNANGVINLSWTAPEDVEVAKYSIERVIYYAADELEVADKTFEAAADATTYADKDGLESDTTYIYRISALDADGYVCATYQDVQVTTGTLPVVDDGNDDEDGDNDNQPATGDEDKDDSTDTDKVTEGGVAFPTAVFFLLAVSGAVVLLMKKRAVR